MSLQLLEKHHPIVHSKMLSTESNYRLAELAVAEYVKEYVDSDFQVVSGWRDSEHSEWRFFVRSADRPVGTIFFDSDRGQTIAPTEDEIRRMQEKAAILSAPVQGVLPLNQHGFILAEYARRQAERYLSKNIAMFFNAVDPVCVLGESPLWQTTIVLKMPDIGSFALGFLDVNAKTGEVIPIIGNQISRMKERAYAIVEFYTMEKL